ncbi:hypothetical protein, partial [Xanthomonas sp. SHU 166]|uniref:hypothetical protein n=1 Tax=Xanthomonas sp. SHU 166 TaxID=1591170 RepID=UPI001E3BC2DC
AVVGLDPAQAVSRSFSRKIYLSNLQEWHENPIIEEYNVFLGAHSNQKYALVQIFCADSVPA